MLHFLDSRTLLVFEQVTFELPMDHAIPDHVKWTHAQHASLNTNRILIIKMSVLININTFIKLQLKLIKWSVIKSKPTRSVQFAF